MPKTKSVTSGVAVKKSKLAKRPITKIIRPKRKNKSVLVDIIEDEPLNSDSAWLVADDKLKLKKSGLANQKKFKIQGSQLISHKDNEKIDSQKNFFTNLATEIKSRNGKSEKANNNHRNHRNVILYRHLVIKFVILVGVVALLVAYFSFSKLEVTLNLKGKTIHSSLLLKVVDKNFNSSKAIVKGTTTPLTISNNTKFINRNDPREVIKGVIKEIKTSVVKNYPSNGETFLGNEIKGRVNIINNSNKNQPLVATTRLLSPDNKLYRIKNGVNVSAGGEVAVDIYTNKPAANMAIGLTTFTIPGLWVGLQNKIYAKNLAPFTYIQKIKKYVNSSDLAYAAQDINRILIAAAKDKAKYSSALNIDTNWLYIINNPAVITIKAKVGDSLTEFTAKASGKIIAVSFSRNEASKLVKGKLNLIVPNDKELTDFNPANIIYNLISYDPVSHSATVKATFTGTMILKKNSTVINPASLVNLTAKQIKTYLNNQPEISSYTLKFFPSFIKKAPSLVDRIKININKN